MLVNCDVLDCNFLTCVANVLGLINHFHLLPLIRNVGRFSLSGFYLFNCFFNLDHQYVTHGYHIHHDKNFRYIYFLLFKMVYFTKCHVRGRVNVLNNLRLKSEVVKVSTYGEFALDGQCFLLVFI